MRHDIPPHIKLGIRIFLGILVIAGAFLGGVSVGYANRPAMQQVVGLVHKETPAGLTDADFDLFWSAWRIANEKYVSADKTSAQDRVYGAIKGMLAAFGDPYTTFFSPKENTIFQTQIEGTFSGVGIDLGQKQGVLTVIAPLKGTPADRAGIKSGDAIVKIGARVTTDMTIDDATALIRGDAGTTVALTVIRPGVNQPKVFMLTRENISLPTVDTEVKDKVFVIHLYNFSAQSADLFRAAFDKYLGSGYSNLLLDLRGNPGGYLEAAVSIAGEFLPKGTVVVKEIGKTARDTSVHTSPGPDRFPKQNKLIVLVNGGSASAAEILAGALSEQGVGALVGTQTFGKGSVQEVVDLDTQTALKVTVAKWYTPHGISISEKGLKPGILLPENVDRAKDTQLAAALALFGK